MTNALAHPGVTPVTLPLADPAEPHEECLFAAVVTDSNGNRVWYPCRSDEGGEHHFAAWWPACPAPWCRLPARHALDGTMHLIPGGRVEVHDSIGVVDRA